MPINKNKQINTKLNDKIPKNLETSHKFGEKKSTLPEKWIPPKQHLGASQFAAALGLNKFLGPKELKDRLEKGYVWESKASTNFGHKKEKLAKYFYQKITGNQVRRAYLVKDFKCPKIVGICDGLIGQEGGLEIKCHYEKEHPLRSIPIYYLIQVAGYLHLYNRCWWDFMSCVFNDDNEICRCRIIRVYREDIQDAWDNEWYPKLIEYVEQIKWNDGLSHWKDPEFHPGKLFNKCELKNSSDLD